MNRTVLGNTRTNIKLQPVALEILFVNAEFCGRFLCSLVKVIAYVVAAFLKRLISEKLKSSVNNMNDSIDSNALRNARKGTSIEKRNECQERIRNNIDYAELISEKRGLKNEIDNMITIMTDVICSGSRYIHVNGEEQPHEVVEERFYKLTYDDIDYVLNAIQHKANKINNIRSYLIIALFNSHATQSIGAFAEACAEI